ncbi:uncharacterized protein LOC136025917 isoform X1 [Artemia franciscana]|uniref:3CxxC-type domain-containing protein n=1 Tax=Artemia franciscana TaxID=6661 RepID=A0AA88L7Y9_ARTSF|nr:hypothetical protein QYM36_012566 [Artemia franciscana]KAK2711436.1 hypothetical protein QYM36_012566 [Artemia franciscana]
MNIKKKELNEWFAKACEIEAIDGKHKIPINPNDWFVNRYYEEKDESEDIPKLNGKWKKFNYKHFYGDIGRPVAYRCKFCRHKWTSKLGKLTAFYQMDKSGRGKILIKFYRQRCKSYHNYTQPRWDPYALEEALVALVKRIRHVFYTNFRPKKKIGLTETEKEAVEGEENVLVTNRKNVKQNCGNGRTHIENLCEECVLKNQAVLKENEVKKCVLDKQAVLKENEVKKCVLDKQAVLKENEVEKCVLDKQAVLKENEVKKCVLDKQAYKKKN